MMKPLMFTIAAMMFLSCECRSTIAQQSVLTATSDSAPERDLEPPQEPESTSERPRLKRVSEISMNIFDQSLVNADDRLQIPRQTPVPISGTLSPSDYGVTSKTVSWAAPNVAYRRLIFEEPGLERHGFTDGEVKQHLRSSAKFYARSIALPIIVIRQRNCPCDNNLGWGTPGTCPR